VEESRLPSAARRPDLRLTRPPPVLLLLVDPAAVLPVRHHVRPLRRSCAVVGGGFA